MEQRGEVTIKVNHIIVLVFLLHGCNNFVNQSINQYWPTSKAPWHDLSHLKGAVQIPHPPTIYSGSDNCPSQAPS